MATRRTATKIEVPIPNGTRPSNPTATKIRADSQLDQPPPNGSPFLPTSLEALLLAIYPFTLVLGSLFSSVHPAARNAPYNPHSQSYDPAYAPSYFARKSNAFNVYFVKIGWFWVTLAFLGLVGTHGSFRTKGSGAGAWGIGRRRVQALARYGCVTAVWVAVTQWFFGPPIIDRSFRWTGGQCEMFYGGDNAAKMQERAEMGGVREVFTHGACKAIGGQWKGGHDISGHVFLLILGSAMLWLEILPTVLKAEGLREARRVLTGNGLVRSATLEAREQSDGGDVGVVKENGGSLSGGVKGVLVVVGMSWWMLLMTAAYFHTWFEKFTGLTVAFTAVWAVYFLPRALPVLRSVVGMPGV